jgi:hypothetical protein
MDVKRQASKRRRFRDVLMSSTPKRHSTSSVPPDGSSNSSSAPSGSGTSRPVAVLTDMLLTSVLNLSTSSGTAHLDSVKDSKEKLSLQATTVNFRRCAIQDCPLCVAS